MKRFVVLTCLDPEGKFPAGQPYIDSPERIVKMLGAWPYDGGTYRLRRTSRFGGSYVKTFAV